VIEISKPPIFFRFLQSRGQRFQLQWHRRKKLDADLVVRSFVGTVNASLSDQILASQQQINQRQQTHRSTTPVAGFAR
jgi:hypothetical protein